MFKAVIFDFDGTVVDSEWAYALTDIEFVKALGGDYKNLIHDVYVRGGAKFFVGHFMVKLNITYISQKMLI